MRWSLGLQDSSPGSRTANLVSWQCCLAMHLRSMALLLGASRQRVEGSAAIAQGK
jgi:hypothetical protein